MKVLPFISELTGKAYCQLHFHELNDTESYMPDLGILN